MKENHIKYIVIYCLVMLSISCNYYNKENIKELESILSNLTTSSFYIAVDVNCGNETFPIVIPNDSFYSIMIKRGLVKDQDDYINKTVKTILKHKSIHFDIKDKEILKSYSILKNDTLSSSLEKNKEEFINKYFANNSLNTKEVTFEQEKAIIYYLFKKRIYCKKDCLSGRISIAR
jgi:hypothetical protein